MAGCLVSLRTSGVCTPHKSWSVADVVVASSVAFGLVFLRLEVLAPYFSLNVLIQAFSNSKSDIAFSQASLTW